MRRISGISGHSRCLSSHFQLYHNQCFVWFGHPTTPAILGTKSFHGPKLLRTLYKMLALLKSQDIHVTVFLEDILLQDSSVVILFSNIQMTIYFLQTFLMQYKLKNGFPIAFLLPGVFGLILAIVPMAKISWTGLALQLNWAVGPRKKCIWGPTAGLSDQPGIPRLTFA